MSAEDVKWLVGAFLGLLTAGGGLIVAGFYRVEEKMQKGQEDLHCRINEVRDEYVRRTDLDAHLSRIDIPVRDMRAEMREHNKDVAGRLDALAASLTRKM